MGVLSNNYAQIVPGALISASYVSDIYNVLMGASPESIVLSGSLTISGSTISTSGFTGSLHGTSSWAVSSSRATLATTASYAISASYINYINSSSIADLALTASYVNTAQTASYYGGSVISSSYSITASYIETAVTASYINQTFISSSVALAGFGNNNINYANVVFVDSINGNDSTGVINNFAKPYKTIVAANAQLTGSATSPSMVYVRPGIYTDTVTLKTHVYIYGEPGVVFTTGGFLDDINTIETKILGYPSFYYTTNGSVVTLSYTTKLEFEADTVNNTQIGFAPFRLHPVATHKPIMTSRVKTFYHACDNASAINVRGKSEFYGTFINEVKHSYQLLNINSSNGDLFSGKVIINAPKITMMDGGVVGNVNTRKTMILVQNTSASAEITINADVLEDQTTSYLGSYHSIVCTHQCSSSKVLINAEVKSNYAVTYQGGISTWDAGIVKFTNNVSSKTRNAFIGYNSIGIFKHGKATKLVDSSYSSYSPFYIYNSGSLYLKNIDIENLEVSGNLIDVINTGGVVYADQVTAKSTNLTGFFISSSVVPTVAVLNTNSNVPFSSAIVNNISPSNFNVVTGLILPIY